MRPWNHRAARPAPEKHVFLRHQSRISAGNGDNPARPLTYGVSELRKGFIDGAGSRRVGIALALMAMMSMLPVYNVTASVDESLFDGVHVMLAPYSAHPTIHQDGTIAAGEYDSNGTYAPPGTHLAVMLMHDNSSLYLAISGPTWGWFALGISSDMAVGMGFVVVGAVGGVYIAEERFVSNVSDSLVFSTVHPSSHTIEDFAWMQHGSDVVAELKLSLETRLWNLSTGAVYATVIASNATLGYSLPSTASGDQIHYLGSYLLRADDSPHVIKSLFAGDVSSVPGFVAVALIALGTLAIVYEFVIRRGRR